MGLPLHLFKITLKMYITYWIHKMPVLRNNYCISKFKQNKKKERKKEKEK